MGTQSDELFFFEPEITLSIPTNAEYALVRQPRVYLKDIESEWDPSEFDFWPIRVVTTLSTVVVTNGECSLEETLSPGMILRVRFSELDWKSATVQADGKTGELKLGILRPGSPPKLIILAGAGDFEYDDSEQPELGGYAVVNIDQMGDPPIIWGTSVPVD